MHEGDDWVYGRRNVIAEARVAEDSMSRGKQFRQQNSKLGIFCKASRSPVTIWLQLELGPDSVGLAFPLPFLATGSLYALVDSSQLQGQTRAYFLEGGSDTFGALELLAIGADDWAFSLALLAEDVSVAPEEDEITLVVERDYLSTLQLGVGRIQGAEEMSGEETQGSGKVVEDEFWDMAGGSAVTWDGFALVPVCDGEVEGGADWQMDHDEA